MIMHIQIVQKCVNEISEQFAETCFANVEIKWKWVTESWILFVLKDTIQENWVIKNRILLKRGNIMSVCKGSVILAHCAAWFCMTVN